jgi:hypothetical protein
MCVACVALEGVVIERRWVQIDGEGTSHEVAQFQ